MKVKPMCMSRMNPSEEGNHDIAQWVMHECRKQTWAPQGTASQHDTHTKVGLLCALSAVKLCQGLQLALQAGFQEFPIVEILLVRGWRTERVGDNALQVEIWEILFEDGFAKAEEGEAQLHPLVGFPSPQGCTLQY